jgi:chromosome partitioning protein
MKTVAILSQKGGVGKTTLAIHLAVTAILKKKKTAIIDLDPQASVYGWWNGREVDNPDVISAQAVALPSITEEAIRQKVDLMLIDTAPHSESAAIAAAEHADLVLIPCRAGILDIRAINASIKIAKLAETSAVVLLNAVPAHGARGEAAKEAIKKYKIKVVPHQMGLRVAYDDAILEGLGVAEFEPHGKAAEEIESIFKWIVKKIKC